MAVLDRYRWRPGAPASVSRPSGGNRGAHVPATETQRRQPEFNPAADLIRGATSGAAFMDHRRKAQRKGFRPKQGDVGPTE